MRNSFIVRTAKKLRDTVDELDALGNRSAMLSRVSAPERSSQREARRRPKEVTAVSAIPPVFVQSSHREAWAYRCSALSSLCLTRQPSRRPWTTPGCSLQGSASGRVQLRASFGPHCLQNQHNAKLGKAILGFTREPRNVYDSPKLVLYPHTSIPRMF